MPDASGSGGSCADSMGNLTYLQAASVYAQQLGLKPEAIVAIVLGSLLCALGMCVGVVTTHNTGLLTIRMDAQRRELLCV